MSTTDGSVGKTPAKSSEPVEVCEPRYGKLTMTSQAGVVNQTPREALANAWARLATSVFLVSDAIDLHITQIIHPSHQPTYIGLVLVPEKEVM